MLLTISPPTSPASCTLRSGPSEVNSVSNPRIVTFDSDFFGLDGLRIVSNLESLRPAIVEALYASISSASAFGSFHTCFPNIASFHHLHFHLRANPQR